MTSEGSTAFFDCNIGVRQGENLSPLLFSIFLNDLEKYLNENVNGICFNSTFDDIHLYLKLFLLLYADDTVIFSNNETDLQNSLDKLKIIVRSGN